MSETERHSQDSESGQSVFASLVNQHMAIYFCKRLVSLDADGHPSAEVLEKPWHRYVHAVHDHLFKIRSAFSDAESLINQVEIPPPLAWLQELNLKRTRHRQQLLDLFTLVVYSVLDRSLLLANVLLDLQIDPRSCTTRAVRRHLGPSRPEQLRLLEALAASVAPLADARHFFAHRGQSRHLPVFSDIHHLKTILEAFNVPRDGISFNDQGATQSMLSVMRHDLQTVQRASFDFIGSMQPHYLSRMSQLDGPGYLTEEDVLRARAAIDYFAGGPKPDFMQ